MVYPDENELTNDQLLRSQTSWFRNQLRSKPSSHQHICNVNTAYHIFALQFWHSGRCQYCRLHKVTLTFQLYFRWRYCQWYCFHYSLQHGAISTRKRLDLVHAYNYSLPVLCAWISIPCYRSSMWPIYKSDIQKRATFKSQRNHLDIFTDSF